MLKTFRVKYTESQDDLSLDLDNLLDSESSDEGPLREGLAISSSDDALVSSSSECTVEPKWIPLDQKKQKLSVTDLSAQQWCEVQLGYIIQTGYKKTTAAMIEGTKRHEELEEADHPVEEVEVFTREDDLGVRLLSSIICISQIIYTQNKVREVWVTSTVEPRGAIRGIIDEVGLVENRLVIRDTKTRRDQTLPSAAQKRTTFMQLQTYRLIIERLQSDKVDWPRIFRTWKVNGDRSFQTAILEPYKNLSNLSSLFTTSFRNLPKPAEYVEVEYDFDGKVFHVDRVPTKTDLAEYSLQNAMTWWLGERDSDPPLQSEKWKCKYCPFLKLCQLTPLLSSEKIEAIKLQQIHELEADLEDLVSPTKLTDQSGPFARDDHPTKVCKHLCKRKPFVLSPPRTADQISQLRLSPLRKKLKFGGRKSKC